MGHPRAGRGRRRGGRAWEAAAASFCLVRSLRVGGNGRGAAQFYGGRDILAAPVSHVTRRDVHARRSQPKLSLATEGLVRVFAGNQCPNLSAVGIGGHNGHPESATTGHAIGHAGHYTQ
jgi:hypothetical protein